MSVASKILPSEDIYCSVLSSN